VDAAPEPFYRGLALSANANSMDPLILSAPPAISLIAMHPTGGAKTKSLSLIEFVG